MKVSVPAMIVMLCLGNVATAGSRQQIFDAIRKNDIARVKLLLDRGVNPNTSHGFGWSLLHEAVKNSSPQMVRLLLERGAWPNGVDKEGESPLSLAVEKGSVELVRMLLDAGSYIDRWMGHPVVERTTALYRAVAARNEPLVKLLLERGADWTLKSTTRSRPKGETPLQLAKRLGETSIASLIEHYASLPPGKLVIEGRDVVFGRGDERKVLGRLASSDAFPGFDSIKAFSPDRRYLAFVGRTEKGFDLFLASARGWCNRITRQGKIDWRTKISWAPDSRAFVFNVVGRIVFFNVPDYFFRTLTNPPDGQEDADPVFLEHEIRFMRGNRFEFSLQGRQWRVSPTGRDCRPVEGGSILPPEDLSGEEEVDSSPAAGSTRSLEKGASLRPGELGVITGDGVRVRSSPDTRGETYCFVFKLNMVEIMGETTGRAVNGNNRWIRVEVPYVASTSGEERCHGYVHSAFVTGGEGAKEFLRQDALQLHRMRMERCFEPELRMRIEKAHRALSVVKDSSALAHMWSHINQLLTDVENHVWKSCGSEMCANPMAIAWLAAVIPVRFVYGAEMQGCSIFADPWMFRILARRTSEKEDDDFFDYRARPKKPLFQQESDLGGYDMLGSGAYIERLLAIDRLLQSTRHFADVLEDEKGDLVARILIARVFAEPRKKVIDEIDRILKEVKLEGKMRTSLIERKKLLMSPPAGQKISFDCVKRNCPF